MLYENHMERYNTNKVVKHYISEIRKSGNSKQKYRFKNTIDNLYD